MGLLLRRSNSVPEEPLNSNLREKLRRRRPAKTFSGTVEEEATMWEDMELNKQNSLETHTC